MSLIKGNNVTIKEQVIIGENVILEDEVYIDYGVIIRDNVHIKKGTFIGAKSIIGEYLVDFYTDKINKVHPLVIGENSIIRSETIIYSGSYIGDNFQTGHRVTIRENTKIGNNVRIGTNGDIQDNVEIGNFVNIHSDVFISAKNIIEDYVWIFPRVLFTNDPTPPSNDMVGSIVKSFAVIGANSVILPGAIIETDSVIGAGTIVRGCIKSNCVYVGNPSKEIKKIQNIKNKLTGESAYPWRYTFDRGMPWQGIGYDQWLRDKQK
ncbi:DapH/DapD/GlmU-related protein [Clostridium sp.]|uniref:acyltransferase n=1 Tax=Clostridium sp. TaxID=1506 RepID=UPI0032165713